MDLQPRNAKSAVLYVIILLSFTATLTVFGVYDTRKISPGGSRIGDIPKNTSLRFPLFVV